MQQNLELENVCCSYIHVHSYMAIYAYNVLTLIVYF